jgi:hypothetical protein
LIFWDTRTVVPFKASIKMRSERAKELLDAELAALEGVAI